MGLSKIAELLTNKKALNIGIKSHLLGDYTRKEEAINSR